MGLLDRYIGKKVDVSTKTVAEICNASYRISELIKEYLDKNPKYKATVSEFDLTTCVKARLFQTCMGLFNVKYTDEQRDEAINQAIMEVCIKFEMLGIASRKLNSENTNKGFYRDQYEGANAAIVEWKQIYNSHDFSNYQRVKK